ncbi:hypothetical protein DERP_003822 [Dermatophagoides pteronyssinus]|uniref:PPIase cyclophilin-type domain-containing protein n=1 Tax=Dermatophagoides pteronyssinus TaxID=6956 RepID=A0ABQ8JLQ0_DERPT|nr:hypothetical protein DERP_003822 [Dermatophagoides pteronyssinus]
MVKLKKLRPRCFFDISIDGENAGRIIFELFNETCPKTCENFKALCTGESGIGRLTGKPLHYKNVNFHRIINGFMIQSGDFSQNNGKGGESIFGGTFNDESFEHKHDRPFLLSMANRGPNTNGSQFFITLVPTPHLDGVHVVFGHVIVGQDVVMRIAQQPVDKQSRPAVSVCISNCGELVPQIKPKPTKTLKAKKRSHKKRKNDSDDDSDDTSSDSSSSSSSSSTSSSESEDSSQETTDQKQADNGDNTKAETENSISLFNPKYSVRIDPDEIPEVPQNRFLQRSFRPAPSSTNETVIKNKDKEEPSRKSRSLESSSNNNRNDRSYERRILYTRSGRKIKGRGSVRYRTPTPDDDDHHRYRRSSYSSRRWRRSETPPYWRAEQSKLRPWKQIISDMDRAKKRDSEKDKSRQRSSRSRSNERHHRRHRHHHHRKMDEKNGRHKRKFREFPSPPPSSVSEKPNSNSKHRQSRKSIEKENHPQDLQQNESNDINTANKLQKAIELKT